MGNERMDAEYAANYILGNVSSLLLEWSKEGATVESIEREYFSSSLIPVPPMEEQTAINKELEGRMGVFQSIEDQAVRGLFYFKNAAQSQSPQPPPAKSTSENGSLLSTHAPAI